MALALNTEPAVYIVDGVAHFDGFCEPDEGVVDYLTNAVDAEAAARDLLRFGARTLALVSVDGRAGKVEAKLDELTGSVTAAVERTVAQLGATAEGIFDPDGGEAAAVLGKFRADAEELLGRSFDPESKTSIAGRLEKLLTSALTDLLAGHQRQLSRVLDPDIEGSPMSRVVAQVGGIATKVGELSEALAVRQATAAVLERSALKGVDFEEQILESVSRIAAGYGDLAEGCGRQAGVAGTLKGDITVELDPTDAGPGRYVLEVKDTRLSLRAAQAEAGKAMANRDAAACVLVFARDEQNPCRVPLQTFDQVIVVTVDKDTPEPAALRLACAWARLAVRRAQSGTREGPDVEQMLELIAQAQRCLTQASTIRRNHSMASKAITEAASGLAELLGGVTAALARIEAQLR